MSELDLFTAPPTGQELRDEALAQVEENAGGFVEKVRELVQGIMEGEQMTGEQIRRFCERQGVTPHHPNAWGAATNALLRGSPPLLFETGQWRPMKDPSSHARRTPVYMVKRKPLASEGDPVAQSLMELADQRWRPEEERLLLRTAAKRLAR